MTTDATIHEHSANAETALAALVDDLLSRLRAGDNLDADQILADHPQFASRLRDILPGLRAMCELTTDKDFRPTESAGDVSAANDVLAGVLGDFRILREIGRGGMGIVYEAIQTSLNRRVALKVLPLAAMLDPRHLQRFKNEAMAAASLDHPNIVEVHAVGCERGVHFYAMRYVEGQTLAAVIDGLRLAVAGTATPECGMRNDSVGNALSGVPEPPTDVNLAHSPFPIRHSPIADTAAINALSTLRTEKPRDFYRLVAELGIQAAEALDHAHQLGIVHRDIKPSNLMMESVVGSQLSVVGDRQRTTDNGQRTTPKLFITDFGLARIESDAAAGLTMTGDLLGTLRYMSPEQAEGRTAILDHRTDIYSLGITLYELLTLQPAFPAIDRQTLLRQIAGDDPPAPRKLNPAIPADLETIVLKAIAKEPAERYLSARQLADDLRLYFHNKSPVARRPTFIHTVKRWGRRHAGLTLFVGGLSLVTTVILAVAIALVWYAKQDAQQAHIQAETNYHEAAQQRAIAQRHADDLLSELYSSDIGLVQRLLLSGDRRQAKSVLQRHIPQRGEADHRGFEWHYLWRAVNVEPRQLPGHTAPVYHLAYSRDSSLLASASADETIRVWNATTGEPLATLPGHKGDVNWVEFLPNSDELVSAGDDGHIRFWSWRTGKQSHSDHAHGRAAVGVTVSPDGDSLASVGRDGKLKIWDIGQRRVRAEADFQNDTPHCVAFHPDGQSIAIGDTSGLITFWNSESGEPARSPIPVGLGVRTLAFNPQGDRLAVGISGNVRLWDTISDVELTDLVAHHAVASVDFSPSGRQLISAGDHRVLNWQLDNVRKTARLASIITAHKAGLWCVRPSPDGKAVASAGRDLHIHLAPASSEESYVLPEELIGPGDLALSREAKFLAIDNTPNGTRVWDVFRRRIDRQLPAELDSPSFRLENVSNALFTETASSEDILRRCFARLRSHHKPQIPSAHRTSALSPDCKLLALGFEDHVQFVELDSGAEVWRVETAAFGNMFSPRGKYWLTVQPLRIWDREARRLKCDLSHLPIATVSITDDERQVLCTSHDGIARLIELQDPPKIKTFVGHMGHVMHISISYDGKTLATTGADCTLRLWRVESGAELLQFNLDGYPKALQFNGQSLVAVTTVPCNLPHYQVLKITRWLGAPIAAATHAGGAGREKQSHKILE